MSGANVTLTGVTVRYRRRGVPALDVAELAWAPGLVHGLLGRNGSGKSTLLAVVAGFQRAGAGQVRVDGVDPFEHAPSAAGTCLVREGGDVVTSDRVRDVLRTAATLRPGFDLAAATRLAERFELAPRSFVDRLSRGQRSALGVVLGLAARAPLTLLDEVTLGLDAAARAAFACELAREQAEHPRTVVVATHLVDEVEPLLDRVTVLQAGRVLLDGDVEAARSRVVAASGPAPAVEGFAVGCEVIASRRLGGTAEVVVADSAGQHRLAAEVAGLHVGSPSLQDVLVHLTSRPPAATSSVSVGAGRCAPR